MYNYCIETNGSTEMGQNVYGDPLNYTLDYLNNNVNFKQGDGKKYKTEEDYYQAFVEAGSLSGGSRFYPSDELRRRLWKRAHARYNKDFPKPYHKLHTLDEMVAEIHLRGVAYFSNSYHGKDLSRIALMKEAVDVYFKEKKNKG